MTTQHGVQVAMHGQRRTDETFNDININTATMSGDANWAAYGHAPMGGVSPGVLNGMTLFDSPLSEMMDMDNMDFGDDIDLDIDALLQEEMEMGQFEFGQGQGQAPMTNGLNGWSGASDMVNGSFASPELDFNDPLLFPDVDPAFDLTTAGTGFDFSASDFSAAAAPSLFPCPVNASPYSSYATTNGSPFAATNSPASSHNSDPASYPYQCTTDNCSKTFRKDSQLKQHQRVHKKAFVCRICLGLGTEQKYAQLRDLERHLHTRHREVAEQANVRSEMRECPFAGCEHRGRRDNVSRHYESKHGGKLKWRKGVPSVV